MKKRDSKASSFVKKVLDASLMSDANSASCIVIYQPKEPAKLQQFKKHK